MRKSPPKKFKRTKQLNPLQKAIIDTLKYRQVFDCPMNIFQIWNYLIAGKNVAENNLKEGLNALVKEKKVILKDSLYSLNKVDYEKAQKRKGHAKKLIAQANEIAKYLKQIPWIEMVAVTGSVAAFNADEQNDIDLLVVTKPKRLFLSRFFLVSILKVLGVYWNAQKPAGTICPNILLTTNNLTWETKKQNLYTANEVSLLYPLFFRHNCYFDFLKQNDWVKKYLPNLVIPLIPHVKSPTTKRQTLGKLIDLLELVAIKFQVGYMRNKKTTEIVSDNFLHFNTHDTSLKILRKYQRGLSI